MHSPFADPVTPLRRFHALQEALPHRDDHQRVGMLMAALVAVPANGSPAHIATAVRGHVNQFARGKGPMLPEAVSYHIAAMLTFAGISGGHFLSLYQRAHQLFIAHDLEAEPAAEALAVASVLMSVPEAEVSDEILVRTTAIHRLMLRRHWWSSVSADVPTAALLASHQQERPREIERRIEGHYLQLVALGYAGGTPLHVASALMSASADGDEHTFQRFLGLVQAFGQNPRQLHAPAFALLGFLPHSPEHIHEQHQAISAYLATHVPSAGAVADGIIAAGLTYLDMVPFQADGTPGRDDGEAARQRRLINLMQSSFACLAALAPAPELSDADPAV